MSPAESTIWFKAHLGKINSNLFWTFSHRRDRNEGINLSEKQYHGYSQKKSMQGKTEMRGD